MKLLRPGRAMFAGLVCLLACAMVLWRAFPLWSALGSLAPRLAWPALGLLLGVPKGLFVIGRSSERIVARIAATPEPVWFWQTYPAYFYPLVGVMITAGVLFRHAFAASAPGVVVAVYVGVGAALAVGSVPYFKALHAFTGAPAAAE